MIEDSISSLKIANEFLSNKIIIFTNQINELKENGLELDKVIEVIEETSKKITGRNIKSIYDQIKIISSEVDILKALNEGLESENKRLIKLLDFH